MTMREKILESELVANRVAYGKLFNENAALEGELDDLRDELAALKREKAEAAAKWPGLRKAIMQAYPTIPAGWQDAADWFGRYFGRE